MDWCFSKTWYEWLQEKVNKKPEDNQIQKASFTFLSNYKQQTIGFSMARLVSKCFLSVLVLTLT